jgi:GT2 family glycosyltransferase
LEELRPLEKLLYTARTAEEFANRLDDALREQDDSLRASRVAFASENTWAHRVEVINQAVRARFPLVSILVVTFNCKDYLEPCFKSIERNTSYPAYEILVLDNASTDGTPEEIRRLAGADPRVRITLLEWNAGFAAGNNLIAREARGDYFVFLNPDTIVTPGWLERLLQHTQRDTATGLTVAVTNFAGNEIKVDFDYRNLREMEAFALRVAAKNAGVTRQVAAAPMFCVLASRSVWETVGEFDECFRIGMFEDDDYSLRVRQAGFHVVAAEDCFVHHFGNASFSTMQSGEFERLFGENQRRFEQKWKQPWTPHQLRSGVRPPAEDRRFTPGEFVAVDEQGLP